VGLRCDDRADLGGPGRNRRRRELIERLLSVATGPTVVIDPVPADSVSPPPANAKATMPPISKNAAVAPAIASPFLESGSGPSGCGEWRRRRPGTPVLGEEDDRWNRRSAIGEVDDRGPYVLVDGGGREGGPEVDAEAVGH